MPEPPMEGEGTGTSPLLKSWQVCTALTGEPCVREIPGPQTSKILGSNTQQNYASLEAMSYLSAPLSVTHDSCLHKLALTTFFLPSFTQLTSSFFKFSCFSMFDLGNPALAEFLCLHKAQGRENETGSLLQHLKFKYTEAIYFRINPLER